VKDGCTHHILEGRQGCTWPIWTKKQVLRPFIKYKITKKLSQFLPGHFFQHLKRQNIPITHAEGEDHAKN
jgi:hypothetical protein